MKQPGRVCKRAAGIGFLEVPWVNAAACLLCLYERYTCVCAASCGLGIQHGDWKRWKQGPAPEGRWAPVREVAAARQLSCPARRRARALQPAVKEPQAAGRLWGRVRFSCLGVSVRRGGREAAAGCAWHAPVAQCRQAALRWSRAPPPRWPPRWRPAGSCCSSPQPGSPGESPCWPAAGRGGLAERHGQAGEGAGAAGSRHGGGAGPTPLLSLGVAAGWPQVPDPGSLLSIVNTHQ